MDLLCDVCGGLCASSDTSGDDAEYTNKACPTSDLVRVEAPHFVAGIIIEDGVCTKAAPILKKSIGKTAYWLRGYFRAKGWKATIIKEKT